jgi:hypothetical protein
MRELEPEFEPFDIAHVSVADLNRGMQQGSELSGCVSTRNYKNSGNELNKWFKTKDITFFDAANDARLACNSAQTRTCDERKQHNSRKRGRGFEGQGAAGQNCTQPATVDGKESRSRTVKEF